LRVMLVDDEQPSLDELAFLLAQHADMEVVGAYLSPFDALAAANDAQPDVVFLDLVMPRMAGAELAARLSSLCAGVRIVFVTAYAQRLAADPAPLAARCLLKPVSATRLSEVLAGLRVDR
jgi:two-component system LytT family response regulator